MAIADKNKGPEILAVFGTGAGVATLVVIFRLWARAHIIRKVGADDWTVFASLGSFRFALIAIGLLALIRDHDSERED